jgi:hypothetical protein
VVHSTCAFLDDVAYACTNIQRVKEEEEEEEEEEDPHIDTRHNAKVWVDFLSGFALMTENL